MPILILMPALSPTMTQGHLVKWHRQLGETVKPGDTLFDIETDKAVMEVEAVDAGQVAALLIPEGTSSVPVGKPLAVLKEEEDTAESIADYLLSLKESDAADSSAAPSSETPRAEPSFPSSAPAPSAPIPLQPQRTVASPLARKMAAQKGIDLSSVKGSGPRGRIVRQDIERAEASEKASGSVGFSACSVPADPLPITITPMRRVIAQRLTEAKQTIPHFYLSVTCEVDALLQMRQNLNQALGEKKISLNDLIARACALALAEVPSMQCQWNETHMTQFPHVDLSVAVAVEGGLITPIIRSAEALRFKDFVNVLHQLIKRAREGTLKAQEFQGGTFTLSNLGMLGVDHFEAIINPPQSGILAVGATRKVPVVKEDGTVGVASVATVTLSADHRVVDGADGAEFLKLFKKFIEAPLSLLY